MNDLPKSPDRRSKSILFTLALPDATGASKMAFEFGRALTRHGAMVHVVHGPRPKDSDGKLADSILTEMERTGINCSEVSELSFPLNPLLPYKIAKIAKKLHADAIIGFNQRDRSIAVRAASIAGIPGIISAQNEHTFWGRKWVAWLKERYYGYSVSRFASLIICTSQRVADEFRLRYSVPVERTVILQNAVPTKRHEHASKELLTKIRSDLKVSPDNFMWVNVARIDYQKGQDLLVQALSSIPREPLKWKVVLVGDTTSGSNQSQMKLYRDQVVESIQSLGLNDHVIFAGWRNDIPDLLQAADAYVHPSRYEGSPLAVLEAMVYSKPIVTFDNASRPNGFVDGEHGLVAVDSDIDSLAQKMQIMMGLNLQQQTRLGERARDLVENEYDIAIVGKKFCELVLDQCKNKI